MPSSPLDSTNGRTTSGVACHHRRSTSSHSRTASCMACHHRPWTANMVERRRVWHAITAFRQAHAVERRRAWHAIIAFGQHTRSDVVGRCMTSPPLDNKHGRQCRSWHNDITTLGQHTRSATSRMSWHHRPWTEHTVGNIGRGMPSLPLESINSKTTSGVA